MGRFQEMVVYSALVAIGWASAPVVQWMWRQAVSGEVRCIADVCVGDPGESVLTSYEASLKVGGLSAVECGLGPQSKWLLPEDYVFGNARCNLPDKILMMSSSDYETHFHLKNGRVKQIFRYGKPSIDL